MNRKIIIIGLISFLSGIQYMIFGQGGCGTYVSSRQKALESTYTVPQGTSPTLSLPQINRTLCLKVYVVKEQSSNNFNISRIATAVNDLNQIYFNPIGLTFNECTVKTINNYQFDNLDVNANASNLLAQYSEPNVINLYIVSAITDMNGNACTGATYMPGDTGKNYIFMAKDSFNSVNLAHQMGHFLNLYHTHETIYGNELPDGSNCSSTGDLCCDTYASPDLSLPQMVSKCIYIGTVKRNGQVFSPSTKNLMALSGSCRCYFTRTQFLRMEYVLNNALRNYLR